MNIDQKTREKLQNAIKESMLSLNDKQIINQLLDETKLGLKLYYEPSNETYKINNQEVLIKEIEKENYLFFSEDDSKKIISNSKTNNNLLIESDNYLALKHLIKLGQKVDIIYIDPPYNTGNNDFVYKDRYVDKIDKFKHSKWLSFMKKRLELARDILSDDGVIFISIDDNEQAYLKVMMDEIFGEGNFISNMVWECRNPNRQLISNDHEYILCYSKNKINLKPDFIKKTLGPYNWSGRAISRNYNNNYVLSSIATKTKKQKPYKYKFNINGVFAFDDSKMQKDKFVYGELWSWSPSTMSKYIKQNLIIFSKDHFNNLRAKFKDFDLKDTAPIKSVILKSEYKYSFNIIDTILKKDLFEYAKPSNLIQYIIKVVLKNRKNGIALDFFAGSGTTSHAVMELNKEDGGNQKFILITNNENNIASEIPMKDYIELSLVKLLKGILTLNELKRIPHIRKTYNI